VSARSVVLPDQLGDVWMWSAAGTPKPQTVPKEEPLSVAVLILILALVLGGVGLFVEALRWLLVVALILLIVSAVTGRRRVV
jgi:hypothetical protein